MTHLHILVLLLACAPQPAAQPECWEIVHGIGSVQCEEMLCAQVGVEPDQCEGAAIARERVLVELRGRGSDG